MSWSPITPAEVLEEFTPLETATLNSIQGAADNLTGILARVVSAARGAIRAGGNSVSNTPGAIPDQVRGDVVSLARWRWLVSFPQLKSMQTDARKNAAESAQQRLDAIADGKPKVEAPLDPDSGTSLVQRPSVTAPSRKFRDFSQEGL